MNVDGCKPGHFDLSVHVTFDYMLYQEHSDEVFI